MQENNILYSVEEVIQEAHDVATLRLVPHQGQLPSYISGQFITVYFPETGHQEGKAYSLSSSPSENYVSLTVHGVGTFSNKLLSKKAGDSISGSLPYGYFYSESQTSAMVMIAGGIGIAPLRSMIVSAKKEHPDRAIALFYSSKTNEGLVFKQEFETLKNQSGGTFSVEYYVTQEAPLAGHHAGRILPQDVLEATSGLEDREFFICGSIAFVRDFWRALKEGGVSEEKIYTEAFF